MDNLKCFVCGRLLAGGDLGAIIWSGEYKVVCQGHVPEGASVLFGKPPDSGGRRGKCGKCGSCCSKPWGWPSSGRVSACAGSSSAMSSKPVGFYFGSELIGVGVKEPGRGFVQYRLDEFLPIYGKVPELHQEVQVGPRWQPPARPGKDPEPGSGGSPDKE